ncbi:MAG TPA: hypothetical protein VEJ36_08560, partial [Nitrososphaerales archaeon]|nr:hypothetical protein [Nitrososphaerales archaeon]
ETRLTRTRRTVKFEEVSEGTRVTAMLDVDVKGRWSWVFAPKGRELAESSSKEGLAAFAQYVESLP